VTGARRAFGTVLRMKYLIMLGLIARSIVTWGDDSYQAMILDGGVPFLSRSTLSASGSPLSSDEPHHPSARSSYCLYVGSEAAYERDMSSLGETGSLWLVHPASRARWYASCSSPGGCGGIFGLKPLLEEAVWHAIPAPVQHVLDAVGVDDPDLVLISYRVSSGSVYVYFNTRHDHDEEFYLGKLSMLRRYIRTTNMEMAVPLDRLARRLPA